MFAVDSNEVVVAPEPSAFAVVTDAPFAAGFVDIDVDELPRDINTTIKMMTATIPVTLEIKNRRLIFTKIPFEGLLQTTRAKTSPLVSPYFRQHLTQGDTSRGNRRLLQRSDTRLSGHDTHTKLRNRKHVGPTKS